MTIAAIIFDMDGLLIDSERIALSTFQATCDEHDLGDQLPLYLQLLGTNNATSTRILNDNLPSHIIVDEFMAAWMGLYAHQTSTAVPLMPGVIELLDFLDNSGIPKSVATSTATTHARSKLDNCGILQRFTHVTGGDQVAKGKPAPDIYLKATLRLGFEPAECLALEDSPNGVTAAVRAGMQVIQVPSLVEPDAKTLALGHTVMTDLHAVTAYLQASNE